MIKEELIKALDEGLKLNRISQTQYSEAIYLFRTIYEEKQASESSDAHANLCTIINEATAYDPSTITTTELEQLITAENRAVQDFITANPVLRSSPADLEKMNTAVGEHLQRQEHAVFQIRRPDVFEEDSCE